MIPVCKEFGPRVVHDHPRVVVPITRRTILLQDYRDLTGEQLESIEKQTLRTIVQALQQYSKEAKQIFDTTEAASFTEVIVLAEDLTQYALEVAEIYPINKRFAGFIDYKRARWLPTPYGLIPQVFLVDAKASKEHNRDTLQRSQLPMDAEFRRRGGGVGQLAAGVKPHLDIEAANGTLAALTTSFLIHWYYRDVNPSVDGKCRDLRAIYALAIPHGSLKDKYNPDPDTTFFGQGKHSTKLGEEPRIRIYFEKFKMACPWRLQELTYVEGKEYTLPLWRDVDDNGLETRTEFLYLYR
jgi:Type II restriction enzyme SfiI